MACLLVWPRLIVTGDVSRGVDPNLDPIDGSKLVGREVGNTKM